MTVFEAIGFFRRLGTTWYDQTLDSTLRTKEMFAQFREAEQAVDDPQNYRSLSIEQGHDLAIAAFELYDNRTKNDDYIAHQILSNLAKFVSGTLRGLYGEIIERQLYWGDGVTFREADHEVCTRLLGLLEVGLETQPHERMLRTDIVEALAWSEDTLALEAFRWWSRNPPIWAEKLNQPLEQYTRVAGWELTEDGQKRYLYHPTCYELIPWNNEGVGSPPEPIPIYTPSKEICSFCGTKQRNLFSLDLRNPELRFLDPFRDSVVVSLCPVCEHFEEGSLSVKQPLVLGLPRNPYETIGLYWSDGLSRIGGHPEWVQYPDYPRCEKCSATMTFIAQLCLTDIDPGFEGISYAFLCSECGTTATTHQCT